MECVGQWRRARLQGWPAFRTHIRGDPPPAGPSFATRGLGEGHERPVGLKRAGRRCSEPTRRRARVRAMTTLDNVAGLAANEHYLAVDSTVRADATIQSSVVGAGFLAH